MRYGVSSITLSGQATPESHARTGQDLAETCRHLGDTLFPKHPAPAH